jgi:phosphoribosylformylglycinamidine synthase I
MRFGVVVFPGSNCDHDCHYVLSHVLEQDVDYVWHGSTDVSRYDCLVLPGGFSYGDYLRTGAVARFSPVMSAVEKFAESGRMVIGICNGFQILLEAGLLPGAIMRNVGLKFICRFVDIRVETTNTPWTSAAHQGQVLRIRADRLQVLLAGGKRPAGVQPQRRDGEHRRRMQRAGQRARYDAPPRARLRGGTELG